MRRIDTITVIPGARSSGANPHLKRVAQVAYGPRQQIGPSLMGRVYAIGDVHGCFDKLKKLVNQCRLNCRNEDAKLIFLGDYIDRGPDSRRVVEFLIDAQSHLAGKVICLCGNHEALAISGAADISQADSWLHNGGSETLQSYGITTAAQMPPDHIRWFRSLPMYYDDGLRFFVHAGINPYQPLDEQNHHDLLWIREPFLSDRRSYSRLIVHGHTPSKTHLPEQLINRLNIDTGAYLGGPLTAAIFDNQSIAPLGFLHEN
jgi:serine/threonine protein phosphatase 1